MRDLFHDLSLFIDQTEKSQKKFLNKKGKLFLDNLEKKRFVGIKLCDQGETKRRY